MGKEERRHSPALAKIYKHLTGEQLIVKSIQVKPYQPSQNPHTDMYHHGLHRVATEYGATCLYLWLMAHSTGALQRVLEEILLDEINHMTKFFGFGVWAFHSSDRSQFKSSLMGILSRYGYRRSPLNPQTNENNHGRLAALCVSPALELAHTFGRVMALINWKTWHPISKLELTYTFVCILRQLLRWRSGLTSAYLQKLFGNPPATCGNDTPSIPTVGVQR
ncbi:MAG: ferritin-like domain-containing protein [Pseudanabaena sp. CRU_2_10]|nr:ferritin-like domain-containing protein [Pseudanabaena sp. CRU_2_10]